MLMLVVPETSTGPADSEAAPMLRDESIEISVSTAADQPATERRCEPVTIGVPFARGRAHPAEYWTLMNEEGRTVPVQTSVLDRWSDGSVRWLLIDFQAALAAAGTARYTLTQGLDSRPCVPDLPLQVDVGADEILIDTGVARFEVARDGRRLFRGVYTGGSSGLDVERSTIASEDGGGRLHELEITTAQVERSGPLRAVVRIRGALRAGRQRPLVDLDVRLHFFAGQGAIRFELAVTNPRRARHRSGYWDLGDPGSVYLRDLSVLFGLPKAGQVLAWSLEESEPLDEVDGQLEIYQDSSGGENWRSINHCNRHGRVTATFRGYRARAGSLERHGLRASPIVSVGSGSSRVTLAVPKFWQNCPKALEVRDRQLVLRLLPRQYAEVHELQGGERKTHTFFVCFGPDAVSDSPLAWTRAPLVAHAGSTTYAAAGVWMPVRVGSERSRTGYEHLVNAAIESPASFILKREAIDEYGWRHFGDIHADHEAVREPGLVSHYNNQYDAIAGFATRFCQTGDRRWWTLLEDLAEHVVDIDIYHTVLDRPAFNHGMFWHTCHYLPVQTATHRSHSRRMPVHGGGPSAEQNYTTGLMLHYFMTGSERSREAVLDLAQWVIDMDDGRRTAFRWLDRGETGLASATAMSGYHGPGRGAGNSINALLDAHRLAGEMRYLMKAERLVNRCIHPSDDPDALQLLDAERRWSYTVFLQVLGKYLEYRSEKGLVDASYSYARAALLRYADWMALHEEPYLDHPERLEFPTETWAAQDARKAAVFEFAAFHARSEVDTQRFLGKADQFFDYAVSELQSRPTSALTRPVVLLLAFGFQRACMDAAQELAPATAFDAGHPMRFVPYKRRLTRRLAIFGTILATAAVVALKLLLLAR